MNKLKPELVRQLFLIILILFLFILIIEEMTPYLSGVLGAITLYVLLRRFYNYLVDKRKWKEGIAAGVAMLASFLVILVPIGLTVMMLTNKIGKAVKNSERVVEVVKQQVGVWEADLGFKVSESIDTNAITSWVSTNLQNFAGGTFNVFIAIGIMYFILYYIICLISFLCFYNLLYFYFYHQTSALFNVYEFQLFLQKRCAFTHWSF